MSGQARRSRVLAAQRHREQVARAIADCQQYRLGTSRRVHGEYIGEGMHFDVARAREYGERLVAEARHAGVHAVVDDWRRAQGREPRQRPEVAECRYCEGRGCEECGGYGRVRQAPTWCDPPGLPPDVPGSALSWQASVRLGRRLLAALDGQPSECETCEGLGIDENDGICTDEGRLIRPDCPDCHGTGHNLHGVLPLVEWSPAFRRKVMDGAGDRSHGIPEHLVPAYEAGRESGWTLIRWDQEQQANVREGRTRVVLRGQHEDESRVGLRCWAEEEVARARLDRLPRWRRGELRHAEQRRVRGTVLSREIGPFRTLTTHDAYANHNSQSNASPEEP